MLNLHLNKKSAIILAIVLIILIYSFIVFIRVLSDNLETWKIISSLTGFLIWLFLSLTFIYSLIKENNIFK